MNFSRMDPGDWFFVVFLSVIAVIIVSSIILDVTSTRINLSIGSGEHTGYVTAIDRDSTLGLWYTNAVYFKTDTQSTQEDKYCVMDVNVLNKLKEYQKTRKRITISYETPFIMDMQGCEYGVANIINVEYKEE